MLEWKTCSLLRRHADAYRGGTNPSSRLRPEAPLSNQPACLVYSTAASKFLHESTPLCSSHMHAGDPRSRLHEPVGAPASGCPPPQDRIRSVAHSHDGGMVSRRRRHRTPELRPAGAADRREETRRRVKSCCAMTFIAPGHWNTAVADEASVAITEGGLTIAAQPGIAPIASFLQGKVFSDMYLEVTARPSLCRGRRCLWLGLPGAQQRCLLPFAVACDGTASANRISPDRRGCCSLRRPARTCPWERLARCDLGCGHCTMNFNSSSTDAINSRPRT